jgi:hypothetical protein
MDCPTCQSPIPTDGTDCPECGTAIHASAGEEPLVAGGSQKRTGLLVLLVAVLGIAFVGAAVTYALTVLDDDGPAPAETAAPPETAAQATTTAPAGSGGTATAAADQTGLASGQARRAQLTPSSPLHSYTFQGRRGDRVTITVIGLDDGTDPIASLIGPGDVVVAEDDDSAGGLDALIEVVLPDTGGYLVHAGCYSLQTCGEYEILLALEPAG